jgi:hypothetical protein
MKSTLPKRLTQLAWFAGYLVSIGAILYGLFALRIEQLAEVDNSAAQIGWESWREEAARQSSGTGPVQRKVPKSVRPPLRVLFSENFSILVVFALIFGSAFYFIFYFFVRATLSRQADI